MENEVLTVDTSAQYDAVVRGCRLLFEKKMKDYGTSWREMRMTSITDQIFIKAKRIKSIEITGKQLVEDSIRDEFIGIINYCLVALIQATIDQKVVMSNIVVLEQYDYHTKIVKDLMIKKNHDYGEAWRDMRISSLTDLILMKLLRVKQLEDNDGNTIVSEGVEANYADMMNYSIFALIRMSE